MLLSSWTSDSSFSTHSQQTVCTVSIKLKHFYWSSFLLVFISTHKNSKGVGQLHLHYSGYRNRFFICSIFICVCGFPQSSDWSYIHLTGKSIQLININNTYVLPVLLCHFIIFLKPIINRLVMML